MPDHTTALIQHWMKTVITGYGHLGHKLQKAQEQQGLYATEVVKTNETADVYTRLSVYTNGYVMRLLECLRADYPVVALFTGPESFHKFATAYLLWKPSASFTLYDLGKSFPEFLERLKPTNLPPEQDLLLQLPASLALLERARQEAILAAGTEQEDPSATIGIEDFLFYGIKVATPPCLRLLTLQFPVLPVYKALQAALDYVLPTSQTTYMAVSRKNYRLVMEELTAWQFIFLSHCHTSIDLSAAVKLTTYNSGIASDVLLADLYIWLPILQQQGFITITKDNHD